MSVVRDMRAQMQQPKRSGGGNGLFYALLAGIVLLGGGGVAYAVLGGKEPVPQDVSASAPVVPVVAARPAIAPVSTAGRLGNRVHSKAAAECMDRGKMSMAADAVSAGARRSQAVRTAEQTQKLLSQGFRMIDTLYDMERTVGLISAVTGKPDVKRPGEVDSSASLVGDFVECMVARAPQGLCDPNDRAAAVSYIPKYVTKGHDMIASIDALEPMKRFEAEKSYNAPQYRTVLAALERHFRGGSLTSSDFGMFAPQRLKTLLAAHPRHQDVCAPTTSAVR
jgi:hypothetical protein